VMVTLGAASYGFLIGPIKPIRWRDA